MWGKKKKESAVKLEKTKKVKTPKARPAGKPVAFYYIPIVVVALLLTGMLLFIVGWQDRHDDNAKFVNMLKVAASGVADYAHMAISDKVSNAQVLASSKKVVKGPSFEDDPARSRLEADLKAQLPGAVAVRLLPLDVWDEDKVQNHLFGSYAATEMFQKVAASKKASPVAALKDAKGRLYFVITVPVMDGSKLKGVLAVRYPMSIIASGVHKQPFPEAVIALKQQGSMVLLGLGANAKGQNLKGVVPVPGTLWKVHYGVTSDNVNSFLNMRTAAAAAAILLLLVVLWSYRALAQSLLHDSGVFRNLAEAIKARQGSKTYKAKLIENADAVQALVEVAQSGLSLRSEQKPTENKAGQALLTVADEESKPVDLEPIDPEDLPHSMFRNGFLRWQTSQQPKPEVIQAIGMALGSQLQRQDGHTLLVARDNDASSDGVAADIVAGALASGCDVLDLGVAPFPVLVQAALKTPGCAAAMVTGGTGSSEFCGVKIIMEDQYPGAAQMAELRKTILSGNFMQGPGKLETRDYTDDYVAAVIGDIQLIESFKVVVDCANGVTGAVVDRLMNALDCEVVLLACEPDTDFLNHGAMPEPQDSKELLATEVRIQKADLGVAFDADGDAFLVVDEQGKSVPPDLILMLLASDIIKRNPGADILYDSACTASLAGRILAEGGRPIMWKSGAARMQQKLLETDGLLAGEFSGHFFIRERWNGFDDAIYAVARLLEYIALEGMSLSEACAGLSDYVATPGLMVPTAEGEAEAVVLALREQEKFADADVVDVDGLRVEYANAWGMVRASHAQPALMFRFEGSDETALQEVQDKFRDVLLQLDSSLELPF